MVRGIVFCILLACTWPAQAEKIALVGGRLIDGTVAEPILRSVVLIDNGIIQQVGTVDTLPIPEGYREINMGGHDLLPGLWENHAHLMLVGHADYPHWNATYSDRFESEIMPAAALQLLLAGVTSTRDLGAPLAASKNVKEAIQSGRIPGPHLYTSGPFLQHEVAEWQRDYRWEVRTVAEAQRRVQQLHEAGMEMVKLIDHDDMEIEVAQAIVDEAHRLGMKVVGHAHKPDEIRVGLDIGIDNFEHTGLTTAPGYPQDILDSLIERTATGIFDGLLFWTPTVEGLWNYTNTVQNPTRLDDPCWERGLSADIIADIRSSVTQPAQLGYMQLTPLRRSTLKNKIAQLKESGVVMLIGTDSGIPMKFHCQSTWQEMAWWVDVMEFDAMETIRAATYWPAVMMGVQDRFGSIQAGKVADIIAVRGDVLRYINLLQGVDFVMKEGVVYKQEGQVQESAL
ncbi:Xaa-Pro dipeptidase [Aliidiomarina shirensis]|uniref:Xaa-Pro dipeptidase n=1 Tax=Aliidiomarina shirensis TaxID=1048642 RepID=A0A432WQP8_9GAMM|nr:amidohydrolase family protein [Aliidiomarina shirensis]RUO36081.1 Xaa-Pro dipeptidase [Aliidiomarina shirensis]